MIFSQSKLTISALLLVTSFAYLAESCHVGSDKLKTYTRQTIKKLLDPSLLKSVYWQDEPLDSDKLSHVTGLNITRAETGFELEEADSEKRTSLVQEFFVTCSTDRDRGFTLIINLKLTNPFRTINLHYISPLDPSKVLQSKFQIRLPKSTFLAQLNQKISYDQCLDLNHIQLSSNTIYQIECIGCKSSTSSLANSTQTKEDNGSPNEEQNFLDRTLAKRIGQLDATLDTMLSHKFLLALQTRLSQERLDLDLYLRN